MRTKFKNFHSSNAHQWLLLLATTIVDNSSGDDDDDADDNTLFAFSQNAKKSQQWRAPLLCGTALLSALGTLARQQTNSQNSRVFSFFGGGKAICADFAVIG